ncbi:hypothetical protein DPMN_194572 [Dreissena polymorpha]|uniref:Uncharacterized protein n=1 Tax=Dreissena polymorpha TaxID=45954 RepID=A0A9D3Y4B6_DREPO|nr:hypothetical protein DPMN_194572 [Dreissena polymorpha]
MRRLKQIKQEILMDHLGVLLKDCLPRIALLVQLKSKERCGECLVPCLFNCVVKRDGAQTIRGRQCLNRTPR